MRRPLATVAAAALPGVAALAAAAQFGPAATGVHPLMTRLAPRRCGTGRPGHVALTFDDGPHPEATPAMLHTLAYRNCRATFFIVGEQAARYPDIVRRAHRDGHDIAVHGWTHSPTPLIPPWRIGVQLRDTVDLITDITGQAPRWYRPPYGVASGPALLAAKALHLQPVWWTHRVQDGDQHMRVVDLVTQATDHPGQTMRRGRTIALHDSNIYGRGAAWRATHAALPQIIDAYTRIGIELGPLSDHDSSPEPQPISTTAGQTP